MGVFPGLILKPTSLIPRNGLVAEYLFTGNANDTSGNGYNGTNNGATLTSDRDANANSAFDFDGTNDYIDIDASLTGLATNTKGTFSIWVRPTDATPAVNSRRIITFGDTNASVFINCSLVLTTGILVVSMGISGLKWKIDTDVAPFTDNVWAHVAIVQDGISPVVYVDGVAVAQTFTSSVDKTVWFNDASGLDNGRIGTLNFNSGGNIHYWDGDLDDVRIYDRNLSQAEITILANE